LSCIANSCPEFHVLQFHVRHFQSTYRNVKPRMTMLVGYSLYTYAAI